MPFVAIGIIFIEIAHVIAPDSIPMPTIKFGDPVIDLDD